MSSPEQLNPAENLQVPKIEIKAKSIASEQHPDRNEDAIFHNLDKKSFGVFDGVGGYAVERLPQGLLETMLEKVCKHCLMDCHFNKRRTL